MWVNKKKQSFLFDFSELEYENLEQASEWDPGKNILFLWSQCLHILNEDFWLLGTEYI